jgi:hypothetical protein
MQQFRADAWKIKITCPFILKIKYIAGMRKGPVMTLLATTTTGETGLQP